MKSLTHHTHGCPRDSLRDCSSSSADSCLQLYYCYQVALLPAIVVLSMSCCVFVCRRPLSAEPSADHVRSDGLEGEATAGRPQAALHPRRTSDGGRRPANHHRGRCSTATGEDDDRYRRTRHRLVSLAVSVCLSIFVCLSVSMFVYRFLSSLVCLSLCVSICACLFVFVYLSLSICFRFSLLIVMFLFVFFCLFLSV